MTKLTSPIFTLILVAVVGNGVSAQESESGVRAVPTDTGYIDVHLHLRGGVLQGNTRINTQEGYLSSAANLISVMNQHGIQKAIVMPPPQIPNQNGPGSYEFLLRVAEDYPGRLYLLGGGKDLNELIHRYQENEVTDDIREEFRQRAEAMIGAGVKGFGEMTALHYSFRPRHPFEEVQADHPLFLLLADIAAEHDLPIDIHAEALAENTSRSEAFSRASPNNPPTSLRNIPGFERLLAHNREARIVWQHVGWDNTGHMTVDLLRRLLQAHPNLYMALKIRINDFARQPMRNRPVDGKWNIKEEWMAVFEEFPDRFVMGVDEFINVAWDSQGSAPGDLSGGAREPFKGWSLLQQLPLELRRKVGRDNATRIYRLD